MKFLRLLISILLFAVADGSAQKFVPGFVVTNSRDTLRGVIQDAGLKRNLSACHFRQAPDQATRTYSPADILAFGFTDGADYLSIFDRRTGAKTFAEVVIEGKVTLLRNSSVFLVKKGSRILGLPRPEEKVVELDSGTYVQKIQGFRDSLWVVLGDDPVIRGRIKATTYSYQSLSRLISDYNVSQGVTPRSNKIPLLAFDFKVGGGISQTKFLIHRGFFPELGRATFAPSRQLVYGIGLTFYSPRVTPGLRFNIEFLYGENFYHGSALLKTDYTTYRHELFVDVHSLKIPLGLQYHFSKYRWEPFAGAGMALESVVKGKTHGTREDESFGVVTTQSVPGLDKFRRTLLGYWISAGVNPEIKERHPLSVSVRYEQRTGYLSAGPTELSKTSSLSLLIFLQF